MARLGLYTLFGIVLLKLCASAPNQQQPPTEEVPSKEVTDEDDSQTTDDGMEMESTWPSWLDFITKYDRDLLNPQYTAHSIKKRYIDDDDGELGGYLPGYGVLDEWPEYVPAGTGSYGYDDDEEDHYPVDKRQASRWKYIYRKLYDLDRNSKRSPLRWKLIYRKLNDLDNSASKRGAGRWRNMNWRMSQGSRPLEQPPSHSLKKRFIGRWKNNNWLLQQYRNAK